jgi:hypothetical protein
MRLRGYSLFFPVYFPLAFLVRVCYGYNGEWLMEREQLIATWTCFMISAARKAFGLDRVEFIALARKYHVISFLIDNYELLHYYNNDYVVKDVMRYISEQGGEIVVIFSGCCHETAKGIGQPFIQASQTSRTSWL